MKERVAVPFWRWAYKGGATEHVWRKGRGLSLRLTEFEVPEKHQDKESARGQVWLSQDVQEEEIIQGQ